MKDLKYTPPTPTDMQESGFYSYPSTGVSSYQYMANHQRLNNNNQHSPYNSQSLAPPKNYEPTDNETGSETLGGEKSPEAEHENGNETEIIEPEIEPQHWKRKNIKTPSKFEIFHACINDLTGKDKLAKLTAYSIRLLSTIHDVHGLGNPEIRRLTSSSKLMEDTINKQADIIISDDISTYSSSPSNSILNLTPLTYFLPIISKSIIKLSSGLNTTKLERYLLILLAFLVSKLADLMAGLGIYRHLLRAGTIPFRIWKFTNHITHSIRLLMDRSQVENSSIRIKKVLDYWTSSDMISQIASFWYALSDEILLIFRFKLLLDGDKGGSALSNALYKWAEDHELYSWMATILVGLNKDWNRWLLLKDEESRVILNQKVRARTRRIVGDLIRKNRVSSPLLDTDDELEGTIYNDKIEETRKEIKTIQINLVRLLCDLIFDAKYIFHWDMYKPFHVSLGVMSGCLGFYNVWRQQKERLTNEAIAAAEAEMLAEINSVVKK